MLFYLGFRGFYCFRDCSLLSLCFQLPISLTPSTLPHKTSESLHYFFQDDVGNIEPVQTATFKIDLTTPIVEIDAVGGGPKSH